mmetsp:Transcript_34403/g.55657  ORF Transcript_34403/g.55657 Transcript_34403/m.55657 type:complete len:442 (+) Transcript_34403:110-1435(+)|eukprot:CAMPEP_0184662994 /NCGR_PEP_ID=MMETSP0308-20130426/46009_1 /TAXON_ID=38269 /ORGANISM="Gloeochaete witrockiana, Strain SAG 46.84" /LENGTH=441 /DNA_ID=CAMNT_0027105415 /DNA_START=56 /DNA_END=1381 /DNA_ORIENTATION=+
MESALRNALVVLTLASTFLFGGIVYGWAAVQLLLVREGQYGELCTGSMHPPCMTQMARLNVIFSCTTFAMSVTALTNGLFLDLAGPAITVLVGGTMECVGLALFAFSDSVSFNMFELAYAMIGVGGFLSVMAGYKVNFLVPERASAVIIVSSCLFDASAVIFQLLFLAHKFFGASREMIFTGFAILGALVYISMVVLWVIVGCPRKADLSETEPLLKERNSVLSDRSTFLNDRPLARQIMSIEFALLLIHSTLGSFRANVYLGTQNQLLINYGDSSHEFFYTQLLGIVLPLGVLSAPLVVRSVSLNGLPFTMRVTNILGIGYNLCTFVPSLWVQTGASILFAVYRAFFFSVNTAFAASEFGSRTFGTILGLSFSLGSATQLLQTPMITYVNRYHDGNVTLINLGTLVLALFLGVVIEVYAWRKRRVTLETPSESIVQYGKI